MRKIIATALAALFLLAGCGLTNDDDQGKVTNVELKPDTITGKNWTYLTITHTDGTVSQEIYTDLADVHRCVLGAVWPRCVDKAVKPTK